VRHNCRTPVALQRFAMAQVSSAVMPNSSTVANLFRSMLWLTLTSFVHGYAVADDICQHPSVQAAVIKHELIRSDPYFYISCEKLLGSNNQVVVAVSQRQSSEWTYDRPENGVYSLSISIVDLSSNRIVANSFYSKRFFQDGEGFRGIRVMFLDDQLSEGFLSFGIQAEYSTIRFGSETTSLYLIKGAQINEVLTDFLTQRAMHFSGNACEGEVQNMETNIRVKKSKTRGPRILLVTENMTLSGREISRDNGCSNVVKKSVTVNFNLKPVSARYVIPLNVKRSSCEVC
jgi:hypothetical protein